ncbi:sensor histidine kinase [Spongiactinospora sp. TRM90649]|uniref:sensor histidine kinase n=1 Tax=Spongiactinospora sp. TRM90649 TaxID=3031114 RepID=UPI0023F75D54|nr:sensor histidine kinase [Spongiactinospora sp. TRM90649]MDF5753800.1 sensor histidine kinase [Spongiactinospora sp. TRM90649]
MRTTLGGLRAWLGLHPMVPDSLLAGLLAAVAVADRLAPGPFARPMPAAALVPILLACAAVSVRRRWPFTLLCALEVLHVTLLAAGHETSVIEWTVLIAVYSVAAHRGLAVSLAGLCLDMVAMLAALAIGVDVETRTTLLFGSAISVTVWVIGRSLRMRRAYLAELKDRAERLERARDADTRAARAEERSRIARELHDVVAHHVSVMTVQAAAARRILTANPQGAGEALSAIEDMGRTAMAEMRNIVGVLRTDDGRSGPAERGPQPGMLELPALVEQMREAGLRTQLWTEGEPRDLPPGIDLAAYRLVQEALTNSLRHAGPDARAWVTVRHEPGEFTVHIEDDGRGPAAAKPDGERHGSGHGLVGIRERVALYGGMLRIGPRAGGGFEVRARFPLKDGR